MIDFEQIGEETYVVLDGETVARITPYDSGYYLTIEKNEEKIPLHTIEDAKQYATETFL